MALDDAVGLVRHVQDCVAALTQEGLPLLSRALLPPTIPVYLGELQESEPPRYHEWLTYVIEGSAPPTTYGVEPRILDASQLEAFGWALQAWARRHPFAAFADLRREALDQLQRHGNRRLAIAVLATAGEVFLDTMILHMMWEENVDPDEAAKGFDPGEGHAHRVAANLPQRLGGDWDPKGGGSVARYFQDLVYLRHRVVHAGHEPTPAETSAATTAMVNIEHFIGARLCSSGVLNKYTRTAMAYLGNKGIEQRGAWSKAVETLTTDDTQPNWIDSYARWRHHVDRATDPAPAEPGANFTRCIIYLDRDESGRPRWTVHDPSVCYAAVIDPRDYLGVEEIGEALTALNDFGAAAEVRLACGFATSAPTGFVPDHEIYGDLTIWPSHM